MIGKSIFDFMLGGDDFGDDESRPYLRGLMAFSWILGAAIVLISPIGHAIFPALFV